VLLLFAFFCLKGLSRKALHYENSQITSEEIISLGEKPKKYEKAKEDDFFKVSPSSIIDSKDVEMVKIQNKTTESLVLK
jgi:hypothetical protein